MIFRKSAFGKNDRTIKDFGCIFGGQNNEKSLKHGIEKHVFLEHRNISVVFSNFCDFGSVLGGPGPSEN